jgi:hypothetical protein
MPLMSRRTAPCPFFPALVLSAAHEEVQTEVKAVATYQGQTADPAVPLASIVHTGPAQHPYQLFASGKLNQV